MTTSLEDRPRIELLFQMGMDIFRAVDTCCQIDLQKEDTSFHLYHYGVSISAADTPFSHGIILSLQSHWQLLIVPQL